jgi:hypothetical protein
MSHEFTTEDTEKRRKEKRHAGKTPDKQGPGFFLSYHFAFKI